MGRLNLAAAIGFAALSSQASGFFPGVGFDFWRNVVVDILIPRTISHADQTSQGITAFLQDHYGSNASLGFPPDLFRFSLPAGVRAARNEIILANEGVDQDFSYDFERFHEKDHGPAHFDNEYLEEGQNHLLKLRSEMIAMLLEDWSYGGIASSSTFRALAVEKARVWLGRQLHTLQDFYAHSNWVEMGKTTISPVIGRPGAVIYPKIPRNEPTCTDYCINPESLTDLSRTQYFAMHTCYRNCFRGDQTEEDVKRGRICATSCAEPDLFCRVSDQCEGHACSNNTLEMARVTTGYYRTSGDPNSVKPSGKCSHGGLSDSGARGIEGINKDSTMQTYSPHWFLHQTAARLAVEHTKQYLADLLQDWPAVTIDGVTYPQPKLTDRHMRLLLGLNHGSLAFVIDRSRSMATALPAVKAAIRAVVVRVQRLGYTPVRWVLVGYGQGLNTVVTATSDINIFLQALDALAVDTTNSCLQERAYEAIGLAARNSLERSEIFFFTDRPAESLPDPGRAYREAEFALYNEALELQRTRLFDVHVIDIPNEPGYPYLEHPWPECRLDPAGTRSRDMYWLKSSVRGRAFRLRSRTNMILAMTAMVTDVILDRYDTPARRYTDEVYSNAGVPAVHSATREIVADGSIDFITLFTGDRDQDGSANNDITVQRPDGSTVKPLEDSDVVHVNYRASDVQYVSLIIPDPQPGTWKITRNAPNTLLVVDIASTISFSFSLVEWDTQAPHGGWKPSSFYPDISFWKPPMWTFKAQVNGPVTSVDAFHLRTRDMGAIFMTLNMTRVDVFADDGNGFEGDHEYVFDRERVYMGAFNSSTFPLCGDFYATVSGTDMDGIPFVRRDITYFESSWVENWGLPRSPGCPPPAVPPVLVDISTFSSTSTTTSSSAPTIVPPVSTTSSSSSSTSSESSSLSLSWSSSSIPSTVSPTSGTVMSTSSEVPNSIFSESAFSSTASITSPSSSFSSSSSLPVSSVSESASSLSPGVSSSQASSASDHFSTTSDASESSSFPTSASRGGSSSPTSATSASMSSETRTSFSVWSSSDVISTSVLSTEGGSSSTTSTRTPSSSVTSSSSPGFTGSASESISSDSISPSSTTVLEISSTQSGASSLTSEAASASSEPALSSSAVSISNTPNSSGASSVMPSSTTPAAASSSSLSERHSPSSTDSSTGLVSSSTASGLGSESISSGTPTPIASSTAGSISSSELPSSTSSNINSTNSAGSQSSSSSVHVSSSSESSGSLPSGTEVSVSITTYTSGSITTSATVLPVSESSTTTSTSSAAEPTTTKKCSCRAKKRKLKLKRDGEMARPSVRKEEL